MNVKKILIGMICAFISVCYISANDLRIIMLQSNGRTIEETIDGNGEIVILMDSPKGQTIGFAFEGNVEDIKCMELYNLPCLENLDFIYYFQNLERIYFGIGNSVILEKMKLETGRLPALKEMIFRDGTVITIQK